MNLGQIVLLVYGLLMLAGGYFGNRAGSKVSLWAGATSGIVLLVALLVTALDMSFGLGVGVVVSAVLCAVFAVRYLKTKKVMPAGALLGVSIVALVLLALSLI